MEQTSYLAAIQTYLANIGITASSLRNQGAPGLVDAARKFLAKLDLKPLTEMNPEAYPAWLNRTTDRLLGEFPEKARRWGAARKAVNIFTTQAFLNGVLFTEYRLKRLGNVLETPLDQVVALKLRRMSGGKRLPAWLGVGKLTREMSQAYQDLALEVAKEKGVMRACLDVFLWEPLVA